MNNLLEGLNKQQHKAVIYNPKQSLAVIAGAGSGKTSVLTKRIAYIIQKNDFPIYSILAVTFTNKAAREMKERLVKIGIEPIEQMWVGTFHGVCHRFLRKHYHLAELSKHFQIIDSKEQEKIIKDIAKQKKLKKDEFDSYGISHYINSKKNKGLRYKDSNPKSHQGQFLNHFYRDYQSYCDKENVVDFGEIILRCYEMFQQNPKLLIKYQDQFNTLLIDEFQDTNKIQYDFVALMADYGKKVPVTVVGDMDQSIYSWRGANMENVKTFVNEFANASIVKLEQNYRSTPSILNCANSVIKNNINRIDKNLWTSKKDKKPVYLFEAQNDKEEARWAISRAFEQVKKTNKWKDTAIIYRNNSQSRIFEEACIKRKIPYVIYGGLRFFERAEIKDAMAHLYMIVNPHNNLMFERMIKTPSKGFGKKTLDIIKEYAENNQTSYSEAIFEESNKNIPTRIRKKWKTLFDQFEIQRNKELTLDGYVKWCLEDMGLLEYYKDKDTKDSSDKSDNLKELVSVAKRFSFSEKGIDVVQKFLDSVTLESEQDNDHTNAIQLMTVHASKGLEFSTVCVVGMEENIFPSSYSMEEKEKIEEERRLAYVAMTRAEQHLYISYTLQRFQYGHVVNNAPSRFINELSPSWICWARKPTHKKLNSVIKNNQTNKFTDTKYQKNQKTSAKKKASSKSSSYWNKGEKIYHPIFGLGEITRVDGFAKNDRVVVFFNNGTQKTLLPQLAKIKKI